MKPPTLASLFPNCSQSTVAANPQLYTIKVSQTNPRASLERRRGVMNRCEQEFSLILEAQKRAGEILRYEFEGITLRWADMRYTPDFLVMRDVNMTPDADNWLVFIEVKGGHIWDRDIVRFKGARAYWPEFAFEMWQLKKGHGWKRKF